MPILVATQSEVVVIDPDQATSATGRGLDDRPTCLAAHPLTLTCCSLIFTL